MLMRCLPFFLIWPSLAAAEPLSWKDSFGTRLELQALLETLNAELLSHPSATATLEKWCGDHRLAPGAKVVAVLERGAEKPLDEQGRRLLGIEPGEAVRYRHVRLNCGDKLLSEADNWYLPGQLTPAMNQLLDETDTPFGRAVRDLNFGRETLSARLLWRPLPEGWEMQSPPAAGPDGRLEAPARILEHRALLRKGDNKPLALVAETYASGVLDFPLPDLGPGEPVAKH
jgi:chorismate-pyruvate lyase